MVFDAVGLGEDGGGKIEFAVVGLSEDVGAEIEGVEDEGEVVISISSDDFLGATDLEGFMTIKVRVLLGTSNCRVDESDSEIIVELSNESTDVLQTI